MTIPRIKTMTIDSHDEAIPVIRLRCVAIGSAAYQLVKDIAPLMSLPVDEDGDYRTSLERFGISYLMSQVTDPHGEIIGPVALITEEECLALRKAVVANRNDQPQEV